MGTGEYIIVIALFAVSIIGSIVYVISNKHELKSLQDIKIAISAATIGCIFAILMLIAHLYLIPNGWEIDDIYSFILLRQYHESMLFSRMFIVGIVLSISCLVIAIVAYVQFKIKKVIPK
jgi:hypothetical protein